MIRWVQPLMVMMGTLWSANFMANPRPSLECRRLCTRSHAHSRRVRSPALMARSVCWLMVKGFGKLLATPALSMMVMSSDRNRPSLVRRSLSTVPVLPVSVRADSTNPRPPTSMQAACRSM